MVSKNTEIIISEIAKKLDRAESLATKCDNHIIDTISDINVLLERNKQFIFGIDREILTSDTERIKNIFINDCRCNIV